MPRDVSESEIDAVLQLHEERRRVEREAAEKKERSALYHLRVELKRGQVSYPCGPCRPCATSILREVRRDQNECLGHP